MLLFLIWCTVKKQAKLSAWALNIKTQSLVLGRQHSPDCKQHQNWNSTHFHTLLIGTCADQRSIRQLIKPDPRPLIPTLWWIIDTHSVSISNVELWEMKQLTQWNRSLRTPGSQTGEECCNWSLVPTCGNFMRGFLDNEAANCFLRCRNISLSLSLSLTLSFKIVEICS